MSAIEKPGQYTVTLTDDGRWLNAPGSDFLFAYIDNGWSAALQAAVAQAFTNALGMSSKIKTAILDTAGQTVVNGLYLVDQPAMTEAMNSIDGMGETAVAENSLSGSKTAVDINLEFFTAVLAGLDGDVTPMTTYLTSSMGNFQAEVSNTATIDTFGTVIGLISVMPELNVVVTTFRYAYSEATTAHWLVSVTCGSSEKYSYSYSYAAVDYNYTPGE